MAGTTWIFPGGRRALDSPFGQVSHLAVEPNGSLLVSDPDNHVVVRIPADGTATVVAGNGIPGFSGDGGPAMFASLREPTGIALGPGGEIYIADSGNNRIRKVSAGGIITTVAGTGASVSIAPDDGAPAVNAVLQRPIALALDSAGNLIIGETRANRLRKVNPAGFISTAFSSKEPLSLFYPTGAAADSKGNVYISSSLPGDNGIYRLAPDGSFSLFVPFSIFDPGGLLIGYPYDVAVDSSGNLYFSDSAFGIKVVKVQPDGKPILVAGGSEQPGFAGDGGPATKALLNEPRGVAVDAAGNLYIADSGNRRVRKVAQGAISTIAGNGLFRFAGETGAASSASFFGPGGVVLDATGNLYIADSKNNRVRKVSPAGAISTVAGNGTYDFSGDGGPAIKASLALPLGLAVDKAGNLFIADADNGRVRKVSPDGIITTAAGNGAQKFAGDGGPATGASLQYPVDVVLDAAGNLFIADQGNARVRKVSAAGVITTAAGGGENCLCDGRPATSATLLPTGLALDSAGNLLIADPAHNRVRKVAPDGTITTVAGRDQDSQSGSFSGDGGPATAASLQLSQPFFITVSLTGLAVDGAGNLFISDRYNQRVRKVNASGIISTVAGTGVSAFSGDGDLATKASLSLPAGIRVDALGNLYIADEGNDRIRLVLAAKPSFSLSPNRLAFSARAGSGSAAAQQLTVSGSVSGLAWLAQASADGGNWLSLSPASGSMPGTISVKPDVSNLAPGAYRGTIVVAAPLASVPAIAAVELTVDPAASPQLVVEPTSLTFEGRPDSAPIVRTVRISNAGSGSIAWTAEARTANGGDWLAISANSGSASANSPFSFQVTVRAANLAAGVYSGSLLIADAGTKQPLTVAVTLLQSQARQTILLSQTGLVFTGVEGGDVVPSQTFGVLNTGQGSMSWSVEASTLAGGNWLTVSPAAGTSSAGSLEVPLVTAGVNVTGLASGQYSGLVRVQAPGANNSPQLVTVTLNVLPAGTRPGVSVRPSGLIFAAQSGKSSPGAQPVSLATPAQESVEVRTGAFTFDGASWLSAVPSNLAISKGQARDLIVQPDLGTLVPGVYRGSLTVLFGDGSPPEVVNVLFLVVGGSASAASARESGADQCVARQLLAVHRTLGANFSAAVGLPSPVEVQVVDDCNNPVRDASVVAGFSNGDPPLALVSLGNGVYTGTWRPLNPAAQVTVSARVSSPPLTAVELQAQGRVRENATAPTLYSGGVVNAASFGGGGLAPGSIVSVFGRNLAGPGTPAAQTPLPTSLSGASLTVAGMDMPLFFAGPGQVNAQLPFNLPVNTRLQLVLKTRTGQGGAFQLAPPESITVAAVQPGIFSTNQQGTGQGAILNVRGELVDASRPASAGDILQVFCTGLGATLPAVASGVPAPTSEPLPRVSVPVEARIGERAAKITYAGLAPGFIGLYQVNVEIPAGVPPGAAVPLVLSQNGVPSNTVTLAIQ